MPEGTCAGELHDLQIQQRKRESRRLPPCPRDPCSSDCGRRGNAGFSRNSIRCSGFPLRRPDLPQACEQWVPRLSGRLHALREFTRVQRAAHLLRTPPEGTTPGGRSVSSPAYASILAATPQQARGTGLPAPPLAAAERSDRLHAAADAARQPRPAALERQRPVAPIGPPNRSSPPGARQQHGNAHRPGALRDHQTRLIGAGSACGSSSSSTISPSRLISVRLDQHLFEIDAQMPRHPPRIRQVPPSVSSLAASGAERHRKTGDSPIQAGAAPHHRHDGAGVQAAGQECAHGHVGHELPADRPRRRALPTPGRGAGSPRAVRGAGIRDRIVTTSGVGPLPGGAQAAPKPGFELLYRR